MLFNSGVAKPTSISFRLVDLASLFQRYNFNFLEHHLRNTVAMLNNLLLCREINEYHF